MCVLIIIYKITKKQTNKVWITYDKSGGITGIVKEIIIYKNQEYDVYDHGKLIKHDTLKKNITNEVNDILRQNTDIEINRDVMDGIYVTLIINGKKINIDYNSFEPHSALINTLDELL